MLLFVAWLRQAELDETRLCETRSRVSHRTPIENVRKREPLFSSVAFNVQVLNHDSRLTEELIDFCCAKPISRALLNLVCCSAHNLTEFSTLGRKCDVTAPAMIRVGFALNEAISLHTPQGNSHCGLLDPYQTRKLCLG